MSTPRDLSLALLGEGAIARTHATEIAKLPGAAIDMLVPGDIAQGEAFAAEFITPQVWGFDEMLAAKPDGVIIATPSDLHAAQTRAVLDAGLPALVEIPMATSLEDCEALAELPGLAMVAHTRRFSPAHKAMKSRLDAGEVLHHLVAETYFMRRENRNMLGEPRSWVDSLIWHHAVHSVDLFLWLTGDPEPEMRVLGGRLHPDLDCLMDATITLRAASGAMLSLVCSFNNQGPFGGFYRYICEGGTWHVFRDSLTDAERAPVPTEGPNAFAAQTQAFLDTLRGVRPCSPTLKDALPAMRLVARAAEELNITR